MDTIEERLPPNSIEAEEAVLGSILIDPDAYHEVARILAQPADFYRAPNRWIWEAICELNQTGLAIDVVTLIDKLRQRGRLEEAGGESKIISLLNAVPTSINAEAYAQLVQQAAVRRRLLTAAGTVARLAYDEVKSLPEVLGGAQRALDDAAAAHGANGTAEAADIIDRAHERLMAAKNGEVKPFSVASGAKDLDALLCPGFKPGLTVIGARPGMGKTSLILWMMTNQIRLGKRAALFALETIEEQVINEMLADLRSSGSWEANARAVLLLYSDEYYAKGRSDAPNQAEVEVAKNRYDPTGVVRLFFNTNLGKFGNLAVKNVDLT